MATHVTVTISGGAISADPETLSVLKSEKNVNIQWDIATDGWSFTADGIVIPDNDGQFTEPQASGKKFKWTNKHSNTVPKTYKYNIKATDGSTTLENDPWIVNE